MPMTAVVAPEFARRYPEAAIIFDNLHAMHDVISDILASPEVPRGRKRAEILTAAARYRDATSFAMTEREWREMARMMGAHNMGGVAGRALTELPEPTVALGATHAQAMAHAGRAGMAHDDTPDSGAVHHPQERELAVEDGSETTPDSLIAMEHGAMEPQPPSDEAAPSHHGGQTDGPIMDAHMRQMIELYTRMLADSVIRRRVMADTAMRRLLRSTMEHMPAEHRKKMEEMMKEARSKTPAAAEGDSLPGTHDHDPGSTR
jgi:hypothetical protein